MNLSRLLPAARPSPDDHQVLPEPRSDEDEQTAARRYLDAEAAKIGLAWQLAHPSGKDWGRVK